MPNKNGAPVLPDSPDPEQQVDLLQHLQILLQINAAARKDNFSEHNQKYWEARRLLLGSPAHHLPGGPVGQECEEVIFGEEWRELEYCHSTWRVWKHPRAEHFTSDNLAVVRQY